MESQLCGPPPTRVRVALAHPQELAQATPESLVMAPREPLALVWPHHPGGVVGSRRGAKEEEKPGRLRVLQEQQLVEQCPVLSQ